MEAKKPTFFKWIVTGAFFFILIMLLHFVYTQFHNFALNYLRSPQSHQLSPKVNLVQVSVVFLIVSQADNHARRQTIRETWLSEKPQNSHFKIVHYFIVGYVDLSKQQWDVIQEENECYRDILALPTYDDSSNSNQKVSEMFYWFHDVRLEANDFEYYMKCDDSTFVRMDELMKALEKIEVIYLKNCSEGFKNNSNFYKTVYVNNYTDVLHGSYPYERTEEKLYWGYFGVYDNSVPFAFGGGYILSGNVLGILVNNKTKLKRYYHSEDVSIGAWLAPLNNVVRIHDRRFDTEYVSRGCQNYYLVRHNISPGEMRVLYDNLKENRPLCGEETRTRKEYLYDWSVPPSKCCSRTIE